MIINSSDYLSQLDAINAGTNTVKMINPSDEPIVDIDANGRIVDKNNILNNFVTIKNDHLAETIFFSIDRYFDDIDLSKKTCIIKYKTNSGIDYFPTTRSYTDNIDGKEKFIFGWDITRNVTKQSGKLTFQVTFYSINDENSVDYIFNTIPHSLIIHDGL